MRALIALALVAGLLGCRAPGPAEPVAHPEPRAAASPRASASLPTPSEPAPTGRLPDDVRPLGYRLSLEVDPSSSRYAGRVEIAVELAKPRQTIWLHGQGLDVVRASVRSGSTEVQAAFKQVDPGGVAALSLPSPVGPAKAAIVIEFAAPLGTQRDGLFKVESGGAAYAFTQFEPIAARRAFPCFDEPGFKTPFSLELVVPAGDVAASNTHVVGEQLVGGNKKRVRFADTLPLPTYLVALAVGPLDVVDGTALAPSPLRPRALPIRALAAKGQGTHLGFALAQAGKLVSLLEDEVGIPYPYDKLDLVAVPDLGLAMENAGLITFSDGLLLIDEQLAPFQVKRDCVWTMAHEISHMWLGDLVTMRWWDDLWLNEAFATWITPRIVDRLAPEYDTRLEQLRWLSGAMTQDSQLSARRIRQPIVTNDDIETAFDDITYGKGAGVIAMFETWLGEEPFRRGLRQYLREHANGSATVDDLLGALSATTGKDVATPFRTFLDQPGVPFVAVVPTCPSGKLVLELSQSRYLPVGAKDPDEHTWQIPICVSYQAKRERKVSCTLLSAKHGTLGLPGAACDTAVFPNADGAGYYRWSLPGPRLRALSPPPSWLRPSERLMLGDSAKAGLFSAQIPANDALATLWPLARDAEPAVADSMVSLLGLLRDELVGADLRPAVMDRVRVSFQPILAELGMKPASGAEDWRATERRAVALRQLALGAEDRATRRELARLGVAYLGLGTDDELHPEAVAPNLVELCLVLAVREKGATVFDRLVSKLATEQNPLERSRYLAAIAAAVDPPLSARALALSLDPRVGGSEVFPLIHTQLSQADTRQAAWLWLKQNIEPVSARLPQIERSWLPSLAMPLCGERDAQDVKTFFEAQLPRLQGGERSLAQTLEWIRWCVAVTAAQRDSARAFFAGPPRGR
jgi:alanyl aminopeptidase